jgi:hypothetical protein
MNHHFPDFLLSLANALFLMREVRAIRVARWLLDSGS